MSCFRAFVNYLSEKEDKKTTKFLFYVNKIISLPKFYTLNLFRE